MNISVFGATDMGKIRELNEDSFGIYGFDEEKPFGFSIVADGMGGHQAGEVASAAAVRLLTEYLTEPFSDIDKFDAESFSDTINGAFDYANYEIYKMSLNNYGQHGMGTTTVAVFVCGIDVWIANVGDSRAYIVRDNDIFQITKDHSVVAEMIERGSITKEEAMTHPNRNIITRAMGTEKYVDTDIFRLSVRIGDKLILCSDGLSGMLNDEEILEVINNSRNSEITINTENSETADDIQNLETHKSSDNASEGEKAAEGSENPKNAVTELINRANASGGRDNITVIGIYFNQAGDEK